MSGRLPQTPTRWLRGSMRRSRTAGGCFAVAGTTRSTTTDDGPNDSPPEAAPQPSPTSPDTAEKPRPPDSPALSLPAPRPIHVPSGLREKLLEHSVHVLGHQHKIHVLGHDEQSRFLAHALSGVYDSVELVGNRHRQYRYIERKDGVPGRARVVGNAAIGASRKSAADGKDASPMEEVLVTGTGSSAIEAMKLVQSRVDENTTVCLMTDGLGVAEDMKDEVFGQVAPESRPTFLLGHMSHKLKFNRTTLAVKEINPGRTMLTPIDPWTASLQGLGLPGTASTASFVERMQRSDGLQADSSPYDHWLYFKLPAVIFKAAVEPVCVLLDAPYSTLLTNRAAKMLVRDVITEIEEVVSLFPELQGSAKMKEFLSEHVASRVCFTMIKGKRNDPSEYVRLVRRGQETNINYQNGYFLRRAKHLGLDLPLNRTLAQMIKAKLVENRERMHEDIPILETHENPGLHEVGGSSRDFRA